MMPASARQPARAAPDPRIAPGERARFMAELLPWATSFSHAPISGYVVGAVALGGSGGLYAGANLEFEALPLAASVHAEQFAVANAWLSGETEIVHLATSATPCGHCRQFLMELGDPRRLTISVSGEPAGTLSELLPASFGPADLGVGARLLTARAARVDAAIAGGDALGRAALDAARRSYAPYSRAHAGAALQLEDGTVVTGRYAECAAYNPSLLAVQCALVERLASGKRLSGIRAATVRRGGRPVEPALRRRGPARGARRADPLHRRGRGAVAGRPRRLRSRAGSGG